VQPSQVERSRLSAQGEKKLHTHARYDQCSYRAAIQYGCIQAFGMPDEFRWRRDDLPEKRQERAKLRVAWLKQNAWHPHQVRHRAATDVRKEGGLEATKVILGHTDIRMSAHYARPDVARAKRLVERIG
jgi:integrase